MLPPGATVVDLLSSDDDDENLAGNVTGRPGKRPSSDDNDDECCIIEKPPPPALRKPVASEPSSSTANDEVQCTGRSGVIALSDFPHARNNCAAFKWADAPEKYCPQCFCYVCDLLVAECGEWSSHCHATNDVPHWQALRKRRAAERLRLPAACTTPHHPAPAATSSSCASSSSSSAPMPAHAPTPAAAPSGRTCEWLVGTLTQVFPVEAPAPRGLVPSVTLKPYQKQSLAFMLELERTTDPRFVGLLQKPGSSAASRGAGSTVSERRGGWLCDEVGMGKTVVSIALILANPEPRADSPGLSRATVVALPPTLIGQWQDELQRFAPGLEVVTFHSMDYGGATADKESALQRMCGADVILTSFHSDLAKKLRSRQMGEHGIRRLIIDESHLAAATSLTRKNVSGFEPRFVWMLTGTPISSSTSDLSFGMVSLLGKPPIIEPFLQAGGAGEEFRPPPSASLATVLRKLVIRHLKSQRIGGQAALSLPEKDAAVVWLDMKEDERALYRKAAAHEDFRVGHVRATGAPGHRLDLAVALRRQAASNAYSNVNVFTDAEHARMCEGGDPRRPRLERCTKLHALVADLDVLRAAEPSTHAVVFTHYVEVHKTVVQLLKWRGYEVFEVSGTVDMKTRAEQIRAFQHGAGASAGRARVFVFTVKLGSVGLTLTAATRVYLMEPAFDPSCEVQIAGRIHRLGQNKDVLIKKFAFRDSIEENICKLHDEIRAGRVAIVGGKIPPAGIHLLAPPAPRP
jgi:superfamily II DNA or RNA helicase